MYISRGLRINIQGGELRDFDTPHLHSLNGTLEIYSGVSKYGCAVLFFHPFSSSV
ncbi:hypothetical protein BDV12DRAFT_176590 [Aspergillus spectabilis]